MWRSRRCPQKYQVVKYQVGKIERTDARVLVVGVRVVRRVEGGILGGLVMVRPVDGGDEIGVGVGHLLECIGLQFELRRIESKVCVVSCCSGCLLVLFWCSGCLFMSQTRAVSVELEWLEWQSFRDSELRSCDRPTCNASASLDVTKRTSLYVYVKKKD